jgi:HD-GYP domain-containing protein (c-di-GMP phosphodiesterase class II)
LRFFTKGIKSDLAKGIRLKVTGKDIPLYSRILTVRDSFDAMTSNRSYRKAMTPWYAKKN